MDLLSLTKLTAMVGIAYLLGAVPFGLILVKLLKGMDLRQIGSGNIGATNARRAGGWPLGLATLCLDVLKGALPVYLAGAVSSPSTAPLAMGLTALAACCGHLFPVYLKFKTGGKGVATAAGCFAIISPVSLLIAFAVFLLLAALSNRVSAGSMAAAASLPIAVFLIEQTGLVSGFAGVIALLIIFRHKDNIQRLRAGTEPPIR